MEKDGYLDQFDRTDPALLKLFQYGDHKRVDEYLYGRCTLFALALHNLYRYQIELFWGPPKNIGYRDNPTWSSGLDHAFCVRRDGSLVDARGTVDREKIIAEYGSGNQDHRWEPTSKAALLSLIEEQKAPHPDNTEMFELRQFLLHNQDVYKTGERSIEPFRNVRHQFDIASISSQINSHNRSVLDARFEKYRDDSR